VLRLDPGATHCLGDDGNAQIIGACVFQSTFYVRTPATMTTSRMPESFGYLCCRGKWWFWRV
jgi:hypothetical protein